MSFTTDLAPPPAFPFLVNMSLGRLLVRDFQDSGNQRGSNQNDPLRLAAPLSCRTFQVVGSSYICYGPLLRGCTTVLYEGKPVGTPDAGEFWRVISQNRVKAMFTAPTAIRAIKAADSNGDFLQDLDMTSIAQGPLFGGRAVRPSNDRVGTRAAWHPGD